MSYKTLNFEVDEARVARLTLNRPQHLNAFTFEMHRELRDVFDQLEGGADAGALVISGAGRAFCAGADLADREALKPGQKPDLGAALQENYNPLIKRMQALPIPVIAAVNGLAAGAGCSFALFADMTIAARSAYFLQAFVNIGLMPDAGGTWVLPRLVGRQRAMGFAMLGEKLSAEEAERWGLIWQVVDDAALADTVTAVANKLAAGPALAIARIKNSIDAGIVNEIGPQLDLERDWQGELGHSSDFIEGVSAFMQKRPAKFKGK